MPADYTAKDQTASQGYELSFYHGVAAEYIFVKPLFKYLSDSITGKNSEKKAIDYFVNDNFSLESIGKIITNTVIFNAAISSGSSAANAVIETKLISDIIFNPAEVRISSEDISSIAICVMTAFAHFLVVHQTQLDNHPNKFVAGALIASTSTTLQIGYGLAEHAYQQIIGESSEEVGY